MMRAVRHAWMPLVMLSATLLAGSSAAGQEAGAARDRSALATLPQSNEALVLTSRVERAVQLGDYRLAIELIEQISKLPAGLVAAPASRTFYPVWRHAMLLYAQLPPEAVAIYRQLHDGQVEAQFQRAVHESDVNALLELFRSARLATVWPQIGDELATQFMERGQYGQVIEVLREMQWSQQATTPARRDELAVALMQAGAGRAAHRTLQDGSAETDIAPADKTRQTRIARWLGGYDATATSPASDDYLFGAAPVWISEADDAAGEWSQDNLMRAIDALQRLPLIEPVVSDGMLVYRAGGKVRALDALTLTPKWSAEELAPQREMFAHDMLTDVPDSTVSPATRLLLTNHLRHAVAIGDGKAFTIEGLQFAPTEVFLQQQLAATDQPVLPNELVARDLETGRLLWRTGNEPDGPLAEVEFQDRPLVTPVGLLAPIRRGEHVWLAELDPDTGVLRRQVQIVGPPIYFTPAGGRFLIASDETSIYLATGNGVIAALRPDDLAWRWAATYPSTVAQHLGRLWWKPPVEPHEFPAGRAVLADDLLVLAPPDSVDIFALDRFTGREKWRMSRREHTTVVGVVSGGLVLAAGGGLACLDLDDPEGRPPTWKSVPLEIVGHCDVRDDRVYVPTREGIVELDGRTGKVVSDQSPAGPSGSQITSGPRNLIATAAAVFAVGADRVEKYPSLSVTRRQCERLLAKHPGDARARLTMAWLTALDGDYASAREMLESMDDIAPSYQASRGRLLRHVFMALADAAHDGADQLGWLRRAAAWTDGAKPAAELAIRIGAALERDGDVRQAASHYCGMLDLAELLPATGNDASNLSQAAWLYAAQRLRALADGDGDAVRDAIGECIGSAPDATLLRLSATHLPSASSADVARRVLLSAMPPEHKARVIGAEAGSIDDPRASLCYWDMLVALDRMDEARAARAAWHAQFDSRIDELDPDSREVLAGVELAQKKLEALVAYPFDASPRRQWLLEEGELLVDPAHPGGGDQRWIVVRNRQTQELQLVNAVRYQGYPRRKTADGLTGRAPGTGERANDPDRLLLGQQGWQQSLRAYWPMRRWGEIAAIPVRGGVVGLGLGPERAGGGRLWERTVPQWQSIPDDFLARSVADRMGLYLTTRPDRIEMWGWEDGTTWWQRQLDGRSIRRMDVAGKLLVVWMDDRHIVLLDAMTGAAVASPEGLRRPVRGFAVVGDTLIVWEDERLAAFDTTGAQLVPIWSVSRTVAEDPYAVRGARWLVVRDAETTFWTVVDVQSGKPVSDLRLGPFDTLRAAALDRGTLRVAGTVAQADDRVELWMGAYDVREGRELWYDHYETRWLPTDDLLLAHPDYVPLLVLDGGLGTAEARAPSISLVSKRDGSRVTTLSLENDYQHRDPLCEPFLAATESRIIVQVEGNVIGYGNSSLRHGQ